MPVLGSQMRRYFSADCAGRVRRTGMNQLAAQRGHLERIAYDLARATRFYREAFGAPVMDSLDAVEVSRVMDPEAPVRVRYEGPLDYEMDSYVESDLVKLSILVNAEPVDALSMIVHKAAAETRGRALCERLKELIPRQLFKIAIQAAIGGRVVARETISPMRKDVLAKCYGGDISRKKKLLEKQKKGKKRMRQIGEVEIPQSAFIAALKMDVR